MQPYLAHDKHAPYNTCHAALICRALICRIHDRTCSRSTTCEHAGSGFRVRVSGLGFRGSDFGDRTLKRWTAARAASTSRISTSRFASKMSSEASMAQVWVASGATAQVWVEGRGDRGLASRSESRSVCKCPLDSETSVCKCPLDSETSRSDVFSICKCPLDSERSRSDVASAPSQLPLRSEFSAPSELAGGKKMVRFF
jgi:hypothetical protein